MIKYAAKKGVIARDPFLDVEKLMNNPGERKIITQDEFKALFIDNWKYVWNNNLLLCTANKLAALTGARCCEILGLRGEFVFDDHIFICAQYDRYGYRPTKTKDKNNVPLEKDVIRDLRKLMNINGNGFVFSLDGGETPVSSKHIYDGFRDALPRIGISEEERRKINIHAWRHFCNTELLKGGLSITQVQAVTRHKSTRMTEHYSHFDPTEFTRATEIQKALLKPKKVKKQTEPKKAAAEPKKPKVVVADGKPVFKLVKPDELPVRRRKAS
jgi:integrase